MLSKKEVERSAQAQEAMPIEYDKQRERGTWGESRVRPWGEVCADARMRGF